MQLVLTPELVMEAYRQGIFPMAYNAGSPYIHWVCPDMRGQLSIADMHIPRRLRKTLADAPFTITIDKAFEDVITACAESTPHRPETWINAQIKNVFCALHKKGHAHSLECWKDGKLCGGIYGLAIGSAFFGESMYSRERDASKIALVHLMARLWKGDFTLFDTQFVNDHIKRFGAYEIPHAEYAEQLQAAVKKDADFLLPGQAQEDIFADYRRMRGF